MCGLVGIAGNLEYRDEQMMKNLLWLDALRGWDSTGLAAVRKSQEVETVKAVGEPGVLFDMMKFRAALAATTSKVFIGHNRKATHGSVSRANAHPFKFGKIVGAHNGTLDRSVVTELEKELDMRFTVDSQAIFAGIDKMGVKELISRLRGAWSIVFYDSEEDTINFIRNDQRPMKVAYSLDRRTLFWASEGWMIRSAAEALAQPRGLYQNDKNIDIFNHEPDTLYRYEVEGLMKASNQDPYKPKAAPLKGAESRPENPTIRTGCRWPPADNTRSRNSGPGTGGASNDDNDKGSEVMMTDKESGRAIVELLPRDPSADPYAGLMTREEFITISRERCWFCDKPVPFGTHGIQIFRREGVVLGPCCSDSKKNTQIHCEEHPNKIRLSAHFSK